RLFFSPPGPAQGAAHPRDLLRDLTRRPVDRFTSFRAERLLDDDRAGDVAVVQRFGQHRAKQAAFAGVRADVRVADPRGIDHAANYDPGLPARSTFEYRVGQQLFHGLPGAALDDRRQARDLVEI